jgi:hypothetical protein
MRPVFCCMATTGSASARLSASGTSTCTCLSAFIEARACAACICVGVQRITENLKGQVFGALLRRQATRVLNHS